ncbi:MAG: SDR family oxidoreductase [Anaerolineales bacterium]|nr:SDR family oxidoreductase [Anaerolineales bacterium]MCS7247887.1 SDR family oxidoreductase [Anaerolineales bacterium]MDW8161697.1 SDR family oxidoreductase [Anaerolineales bacterium]MDW8446515.1 SDR family oxidoreductase [Anaerolineales bacterium]
MMINPKQRSSSLILVTGATGYIGGRLVPALLEKGYRVRVLARDPRRLQGRPWLGQVEVAEGDVLRPETLPHALKGVTAAYYLVHSMTANPDFDRRDLQAAQNFAQVARQEGVQRMIYLGGLGDPQANLSKHLRSRQQTGEVLRQSGIPVTEFRAAIVVGSGSISFEMIRYLTERIPLMICPRWVYQRVQPIAIRDVIAYLVAALETPESADQTIEIGGAEVLTYGEMLLGYARARGLKRWLVPVPFLTPRLSSYWVHLVTPIPASLARPLIDGLRNEVIVRDSLARQLFPDIQPLDYQSALALALAELDAQRIETSWSDALSTSQGDVVPVSLTIHEGMILERRQEIVDAPPSQTFRTFARLGGETGWLYLNILWQIRGAIDRLIGGVGLRRGRRDPESVRVGDAIDFWRVEAVEEERRLLLRAEMKLPGKAWLQFEALPYGEGQTRLIQTAFFAPKGLSGLAYWYLLYPIHSLIFSGLIRKLKLLASRPSANPVSHPAAIENNS